MMVEDFATKNVWYQIFITFICRRSCMYNERILFM